MASKSPKPPKPEGRQAVPRFKKRKPKLAKSEPADLFEAIYPTADSTTLSALIRGAVTEDDLANVKNQLHRITDRSLAIISAATAERALERAIIPYLPMLDSYTFKKLISNEGPLSSFYSKIHLAFALGTIDEKNRDNLDIIRAIRNVFAHTPKTVSFSTPLIAKECRKLKLSHCTKWRSEDANERFTQACQEAVTYLVSRLEATISAKAGQQQSSPSKF
jgi:hypothetical protein